MPVRFAILASGSKGNASVVQSDRTTLVIDAGLGVSEFERRLAALGLAIGDINALLVTHLHGDHLCDPVLRACAKCGVPFYYHRYVSAVIGRKFPAFETIRQRKLGVAFDNTPFMIGDIKIEPVPVPHDADGATVAVVAHCPEGASCRRIVIATDFGNASPPIIKRFADSDALIIEFNHDVAMLKSSDRSEYLKKRVNGSAGHLSNAQAARALSKIIASSNRLPAIVVAAHLSRECNTPYLAMNAARAVLDKHGLKETHLHVASQDVPSGWFTLSALQNQCSLF